MPLSKMHPAPLTWVGRLFLVLGMSLAIVFTAHAFKETDPIRGFEFFIIGGLLLALTGLVFIIHTRRKVTRSPITADVQY